MGFATGFAAGLAVGKKKWSGAPSPDWQPPESWIEVPEPGPWEVYCLVDICLKLEFGLEFRNPVRTQSVIGNITVDWGDGNIESYEGDNMYSPKEIKHLYEAEGQYLIKTTVDGQSCLFSITSDYGTRPEIAKALLIAKLGENICLDYHGGNYRHGNNFNDHKKLRMVKINGNTPLTHNCFYYCTSLNKIEMKYPPVLIPRNCFSGNYCLSENGIDLSKVTEIGEYAFDYCYSLKKLNLPNCTNIKESAFLSCYPLQSVYAPLCTNLGDSCFYFCSSLSEISVKENCTFGNQCFYGCYNLYPRPDGLIN